ncbi:MAG: beta-galactosidase [Candidatus Saganbacteria bacterium]|uniref:beta-galactosidase n=1 Tax=Candidatus Saganbacteria bacterium TaxID=2575572 RepID=A0A833L2B2_UNCSA|nr:MAG: beta-galactosidase [Candidatus Saganbacteria bacterium]
MQFGVTYYPDQHPRDSWDEEFSKIKKTGFEIVRFLEMAWDFIEPAEGKWSFDDLDHAINLCEKHKLKVVLGVPVAQAPQWLVKKHPEILHAANDGTIHPEYGPRPNACRDNPIFKQYAETLTKVLAQKYAKHPALFMWQIDNEPGYPPLDLTDNKDYCHCLHTKQAFIEWAKSRYGSIEKLNDAWGTKFWTGTFSAFDEISTPKGGMWDAGNPHIYLDWFRFKSENISKWLINLKKIIREHDKEHKVGTNSFTSIPNRIVDHSIISHKMDWFGWDIYPKGTENTEESLSQIASYWRSICQASGSEFIVSELQGGSTVRWGCGEAVSGKDISSWVNLLAKQGAKIILFHNWRPPLFGSETGGFGILKPDGSTTERHQAIIKIIQEYGSRLRQSGLRVTEDAPSSVCIYYSKDSEIQTFQEEGFSRPCSPKWFSGRGNLGLFFGLNSIAGAYRLASNKNRNLSFVFDLNSLNCKFLLLTNPYLLSTNDFENIQSFIEGGGKVISESRLGVKDENGHLHMNPLFEKLLNVESISTEIINNSMKLKNIKALAYGFRDIVKLKDSKSKVLLKFSDELPAIIERNIGKGKIVYAAFSMFSSMLESNNLLERMKNALRIL